MLWITKFFIFCCLQLSLAFSEHSSNITLADYPEQDIVLKFSPSRRHHIAHFCPNLDKARKCIRKCMKEGKPAFCGKDHVCYCGHRYSHNQKKDKLDPEEIRTGFYDLYLKYFGTETFILNDHTSETNEAIKETLRHKDKIHEDDISDYENNKNQNKSAVNVTGEQSFKNKAIESSRQNKREKNAGDVEPAAEIKEIEEVEDGDVETDANNDQDTEAKDRDGETESDAEGVEKRKRRHFR